jgi:hypothetical protein
MNFFSRVVYLMINSNQINTYSYYIGLLILKYLPNSYQINTYGYYMGLLILKYLPNSYDPTTEISKLMT